MKEMMPPLLRHELRQYDRNNAILITFADSVYIIHQGLNHRTVRRMQDNTGRTVDLVRVPVATLVRDSSAVARAIRDAGSARAVAWSEPGQMRDLYRCAPDAVRELGPHTAILDLRRLLHSVQEDQHTRNRP